MKIEEYLSPIKEEMPLWLKSFRSGDELNIADIISSSRVVYYPGSLFDGQPIRTFNRAGYSHVFIYADYGVSESDYLREIEANGCRGYHILETRKITEKALTPHGWRRHVQPDEQQVNWIRDWLREPFAVFTVFERDADYDDSHGSERFMLIYLGADGIATYDALFGNKYCRSFVLILQDHGFGCNYNRFGKGGLMNRIAEITGAYPEMMLCEYERNMWNGYKKVEGLEPEMGGMHRNRRYLFVKKT